MNFSNELSNMVLTVRSIQTQTVEETRRLIMQNTKTEEELMSEIGQAVKRR